MLWATALVACGGGDDGAASEATDKYVGSWSSACTDLSTVLGRPNSYKSTLTLRKTGAASYASATANVEWANTSCAGPSTPIVGKSGVTVFTIVGTKRIGSDKLNYPREAAWSARAWPWSAPTVSARAWATPMQSTSTVLPHHAGLGRLHPAAMRRRRRVKTRHASDQPASLRASAG